MPYAMQAFIIKPWLPIIFQFSAGSEYFACYILVSVNRNIFLQEVSFYHAMIAASVADRAALPVSFPYALLVFVFKPSKIVGCFMASRKYLRLRFFSFKNIKHFLSAEKPEEISSSFRIAVALIVRIAISHFFEYVLFWL